MGINMRMSGDTVDPAERRRCHLATKTLRFKRKALLWMVGGTGALFCVWRILSFTPREIDGPNTLRPMIAALFVRFMHGHGGTQDAAAAWKSYCILSLLLPVALALLNYRRPIIIKPRPLSGIVGFLCSQAVFLASVFWSILIVRAPSLVLDQLNLDESQFIASAHKLFRDPVFFRSVDCGTTGPVNVYPLMFPAFFGLTPDYASSRLIGILMVFVSAWILYRALAQVIPDTTARCAILPLSGVFAVLGGPDYLHYSSELPPILILSAAVYATLRVITSPARLGEWHVILGVLLGLSFFAKIQSVPLTAATALTAVFYAHKDGWRRNRWCLFACLTYGVAAPFALNAVVCALTGVSGDFWKTYIEGNLAYVGEIGSKRQSLASFVAFVLGSVEARLYIFTFVVLLVTHAYLRFFAARHGRSASLGPPIVAGAAFAILLGLYRKGVTATILDDIVIDVVAAIAIMQLRAMRPLSDPESRLYILGFVLTGTSALSIYVANRNFIHYLTLLFVPMAIAMASFLIIPIEPKDAARGVDALPRSLKKWTRTAASSVYLLLFVAANLGSELSVMPDSGHFVHCFKLAQKCIRPASGDYIRSLTNPGAAIVVWGWDASLYLASGRPPATRDTNMRNFFLSSRAINNYYRERFMTEMSQKPPEMFIDVAIKGRLLDDKYRFETVSRVKKFIEEKYTYMGKDLYERRYYLRSDLFRVQRPGT